MFIRAWLINNMKQLPGQYTVIIHRKETREWETFRLPGQFGPQDIQRRFPGAIVAVRVPCNASVFVREFNDRVCGPIDAVWDGIGSYAMIYTDVTKMRAKLIRDRMRSVLLSTPNR